MHHHQPHKGMSLKPSASIAAMMALLFAAMPLAPAGACTRVFWNDNSHARVVGRSMDLFRSDEARIVVAPRGATHRSSLGHGRRLTWTTAYGTVAVTAFGGLGTSDGMNERGLVANLLYLDKEVYEPRDGRPGLANAQWAQYVLDRFATVDQALAGLRKVQVVSVVVKGQSWPLHLSLADASGDSAVLEYVDGKLVVYHGHNVRVMTNEPTYDKQIANLAKYKAFGGRLSLPGDIDPLSRYVRAAFLKTLPPPSNERDALTGVAAVIRTASVPPGAKDRSGNEEATDTWVTLWTTFANATAKRYYFQASNASSGYWIDLTSLNLNAGAPTYTIDAYDHALSGDITSRLPSPANRTRTAATAFR